MPNQFTASLWGDEGFSAVLSMKSIPEIIEIITKDTSPPLYNITEHLAFQAFGVSEVVIRGLSFFYYCLAILFVYKIGSFLWGYKTALLAAVLSFLNPFFFIYAFEGRMYSIMALGVAASMYFFIRIIYQPSQKKGKTKKERAPWGSIIGYVVATSWALYSHHFAIFILLLQGTWFLWELFMGHKNIIKYLLISFIATGLVYSPWLIPLYNQTKMVGGGFWLGTPSLTDMRTLIYEYLATGTKHSLSDYALWAVFAALVVRRWHKNVKASALTLTWFLFPIVASWAISQKFTPVFYNRYLLYAIPGAMIILASNRRKLLSSAILGVLIGLFLIIDIHYFTHPTKKPFKEVALYVKENKRGDDFLINYGGGNHHLWETKYYGIPAPIYIPDGGNLPFFVGTALMEEGDIVSKIPPKTNRVVAITSGPVDDVVIPGYTEKEVKTFGDVKVVWLSK